MLNLPRIYLKNKTYQVDTLPSEPALLVELIDLCHDDAATFEMFADAISKDAGLATKILQIANSPAYRQWNESVDIRRFLIVLGLQNVKQIVISNAIQQFFASFGKKFDDNLQLAWFRSLVCSSLTKQLADFTGFDNQEEAYLAGLLFQIGQLLLLINYPKDYPAILRQYYHAENFRELERARFGVDHCELGAALLESWKMDSFIADAILFQHAPIEELQNAPLLLKILAVASSLSSQNFEQPGQDSLERAGQLFNMTEASVSDCFSKALEQAKRMVETLGYNGESYLERNLNKAQHSDRQQEIADGLSERVKNIALSKVAINTDSSEAGTLARDIRTAFSALFGFDSLFLFQKDPSQQKLAPVNDLNLKQLNEISLSLKDQKNSLVKSFTSKTWCSFQADTGSITDRQILRLLKTENAYVFPLQSNSKITGVLTVGIAAAEPDAVEKKLPFIRLLVNELAKTHKRIISSQRREAGISLPEFRKIAHEVSNPLTIIKNYLYILGKKIDQDHPAQEELSFINEEIERAGNILLRAKDPDRFTQKTSKLIDINKLITTLDGVLQQSLYRTNTIESNVKLDPGVPQLRVSGDKLKQVLINLIKNAVEAMENGGRIDISTRDHFFQNGLEYVEISLKDNGSGIPEEILKNLFKPVTSTKEGHSGLGLSIVRNLVSELAGTISCYSNPEFGTEFKILLPRDTKQNPMD